MTDVSELNCLKGHNHHLQSDKQARSKQRAVFRCGSACIVRQSILKSDYFLFVTIYPSRNY